MEQATKTERNGTRAAAADPAARVSVLVSLERDAVLIRDVLQKAGIGAEICPDAAPGTLAAAISGDCLILAEELLSPTLVESVHSLLQDQPAWSDFPLLLLTLGGEVSISSQQRRALREPLGNLILLERPVRPETLISTVQSALRARRRQYQIRDQIEQYHRAEDALRESEKLAVAGRLASSIAHEINNPLESVTNLLFLMRGSESITEIKQFLRTAEQELARVSEISSHTLKFYRQSTQPIPVLLAEVLDSALALYHPRLISAGVAVEKSFSPVLPILGMPGELRQVFSNFIGNALDAMRSGGRLLLRIRNSCDSRDGIIPGVRITIADTGSGIPADIRPKIFEPFVTSKGATGTGLGLWISSEIVQKHDGHIDLKTRTAEPAGTVFSIFLPGINSYTESPASPAARVRSAGLV